MENSSTTMAANEQQVYNTTTVAETKRPGWFVVPTSVLSKPRFVLKVAEVLLSFVAFILEEVVSNCTSCTPLYVFEFFSCTAFLFTTLLLVLLATTLHQKVGITCWPTLDLCYTLAIGVLFLIASIVFSADNGGSQLEGAAVVFGFLASFAFLVDAGIFVKTSGLPCRSGPRPAPDGPQHRAPEVEKLNANGTE
ncbi:CKLF-like MARVEL transmembrane domain-containing protein 6-like [Scleropages formosus]|uniref:CKLF-like MARVEL transmembrane domain-containing protein 6-like n=1 Tax=Scleropages formosus TaxID=113540 RepID=A0A0N8JVE6_SCLFO|nr:CKLF-like MARVEL transmembrane domain-containing protein 6-like [Scleropages formosus]